MKDESIKFQKAYENNEIDYPTWKDIDFIRFNLIGFILFVAIPLLITGIIIGILIK
jgi:uncharacterized membrane protein